MEFSPLACEGSAEGALRVERPKGGACGPQGDLGGAGSGQEGGARPQGGGEKDSEAPGSQKKGELSHAGVRCGGGRGKVVHQEKGSKEHLSFGHGDVGGEPLPRRSAGEEGEAGLERGAEQERLVLGRKEKSREQRHQARGSSGTRATRQPQRRRPSQVWYLRPQGPLGGWRYPTRPRWQRPCLPTAYASHMEMDGDRPISCGSVSTGFKLAACERL
jgi:hypothetical protein